MHFSELFRFPRAIRGKLVIYPTMNWRAEILQAGLEFDNLKPLLNSGIFKYTSPGLTVPVLRGDDPGLLKEDVKIYQIGPMLPLNVLELFPIFYSPVHP
jgi:hypothetical protein